MSRIGKKPIDVPAAVKVSIDSSIIRIEGPKGKLQMPIHKDVKVTFKDNRILVRMPSEQNKNTAPYGMMRSRIFNMVKGVTDGYVKELQIQGVGFKAESKGKELVLNLGFTHPIKYPIPEGITVKTPKPVNIIVEGIDKARVGEVASKIRGFYEPEPYKGKGVRYAGEYVRHKAGKTVA